MSLGPYTSIQEAIDRSIECDIDFWIETKQREAEQLDLITESQED